MEFYQKLDALMKITGLTNSRLAKAVQVDPSLVSRWRSGNRAPTANSSMLIQVASCLAGNIATDYQANLAIRLIDPDAPIRKSRKELSETIFAWLNDGRLGPGFEGGRLAALSDIDANLGNAFAGPEGRHLVIRRLFDLFDTARPNQSLMFYSSDIIEWIRSDIDYRQDILAKSPGMFDNVSNVMLILQSNPSVEEYTEMLRYIIPFARNAVVEIVQIPRYRKDYFTNTILLAGNCAAASHGFAGSNNFMTNIYSDERFIKKLSADFRSLHSQCERIHSVERDVVLYDILSEETGLFQSGEDLIYAGNAIPCALIPPELLSGICREAAWAGEENMRLVHSYFQHFADALQGRKMFFYIPLYTPTELERGEVMIPGISGKARQPKLSPELYRLVLANMLRLLETHSNIGIRPIEPFDHSNSIIFQGESYICVVKTKAPCLLYTSRTPNIIQAFAQHIVQKYGASEQSQAERRDTAELLRARVAQFAECMP